ncbi:hypothetical protein [Urechidicola croceus]|uniref:Uncharacterized protein n=1 Tax=Urechidicola croceus TaxID=1850246 RepID=A0A1D8P5S3_9FLAO|nr:hypothetical protein [Urechidicola croceus]AOW19923.1 hypothetical protein LPB138_04155 [Urechidicola croceus]
MKKIISPNVKTAAQFTVSVDQVNDNRALLPIVLYEKMEGFILNSVHSFQNKILSEPSLYKLNILKNAFLNDQLQLKSCVKKLNEQELQLSVEVYKELDDLKDTVCNALFSFELKKDSVE